MQFRVLGPLEISTTDGVVALGRSRQERVLAVLLLDAGRMVSVDRLVAGAWDGEPPRTARKLLQNSVSALRQQLVDAGVAPEALVTGAGGYSLRVADGELDLHVFERHLAAARGHASAGDSAAAAAELRAGLALWRGPVLAGLANSLIERRVVALEDSRLTALEECLGHELALGRHEQLIGELSGLVAEHPDRERLVGHLMLALYRSGRQAEALAAFRTLRDRLVEELGIDPGAEVSRLHESILRADPALTEIVGAAPLQNTAPPPDAPRETPEAPRETPEAPRETPAQLPAELAGFAGRAEHLARLDGLLPGPERAPGVGVVTIGGPAGVGKTALAVHWAHRVADRFPDGQLYVNLRGFDPSDSAVNPLDALRGFLDGFGVPLQRLPADVVDRAALYRSLVAGRRVLVVLDNARDAEQVRPLLPGSPGSLAVVTSRNQLAGLVAAEGAHPLELGLLAATEARELLARRLGEPRVDAEPAAVAEIVARCARLPLALAIVAARAATRPQFPLSALADELRDSGTALDALDAGDGAATDVRAVFSWSYRGLTDGAARLFRLLGIAPGPDIGTAAAASLAGVPVAQVRPLLAELARAHLVSEHAPGRYGCHDLLRAYAAELAESLEPAEPRAAARRRVLDHYLYTAHDAVVRFEPHRDGILAEPLTAGVHPEDFTDRRQAMMAWFTVEHDALVSAVHAAAAAGLDGLTWRLAWTMTTFLNRLGHYADLASTQAAALDAAGRLGDRAVEAEAHRHLGKASDGLARASVAHDHFGRAQRLFAELGDRTGQAYTLMDIASLFAREGRHHEAIGHTEDALTLFRRTGNESGQARALGSLGWYDAGLGNYEQSLVRCREALAMHERLGGRYGQAGNWDSIGYAHHHLGQHRQAIEAFRRSLELLRDAGGGPQEADVLVHLGDAQHAAGDRAAAHEAWREALTILERAGGHGVDAVRAKLPVAERPGDRMARA